jgi:hypothetical protein
MRNSYGLAVTVRIHDACHALSSALFLKRLSDALPSPRD